MGMIRETLKKQRIWYRRFCAGVKSHWGWQIGGLGVDSPLPHARNEKLMKVVSAISV